MEKVEIFKCLTTASAELNANDKHTKSIDLNYPWRTKNVSLYTIIQFYVTQVE